MTTIQIARHEILMTGKLTCFTFAVQTTLQFLPFIPSWMTPWLWLLASALIVIGLKSDVKFYEGCPDGNVKLKRLLINLILFFLAWLLTLRSFHYLQIPPFQEKDGEMAEASIPDLEVKLLSSKIFEEFGEIKGLVMLMIVHLSSVGTLVSMIKVGMLLLESVLAWLGTAQLFPAEEENSKPAASPSKDDGSDDKHNLENIDGDVPGTVGGVVDENEGSEGSDDDDDDDSD